MAEGHIMCRTGKPQACYRLDLSKKKILVRVRERL